MSHTSHNKPENLEVRQTLQAGRIAYCPGASPLGRHHPVAVAEPSTPIPSFVVSSLLMCKLPTLQPMDTETLLGCKCAHARTELQTSCRRLGRQWAQEKKAYSVLQPTYLDRVAAAIQTLRTPIIHPFTRRLRCCSSLRTVQQGGRAGTEIFPRQPAARRAMALAQHTSKELL